MRLRNSINAPDRYDDEVAAGRLATSIKPAYPKLMAKHAIPFNPNNRPAAFPSLPMVDAPCTATISLTVSSESQVPERDRRNVISFDSIDQRGFSIGVDWQKSNDLIRDSEDTAEVTTSPFEDLGFEHAMASSPSPGQDELVDKTENVRWSTLGLAMQLEIFTKLFHMKGPIGAAQILGLSEEELSAINSVLRDTIITPIIQDTLYEEVERRYREGLRDYNHPETHGEVMSRNMDQFILAERLYNPYEFEVDRAREFLRQQNVDVAVAGLWDTDHVENQGKTRCAKTGLEHRPTNITGMDSGYDSGLSGLSAPRMRRKVPISKQKAHGQDLDYGTRITKSYAPSAPILLSHVDYDPHKNNVGSRKPVRHYDQRQEFQPADTRTLPGSSDMDVVTSSEPKLGFSAEYKIIERGADARSEESGGSSARRNDTRKARFSSDAHKEMKNTEAYFSAKLQDPDPLHQGSPQCSDDSWEDSHTPRPGPHRLKLNIPSHSLPAITKVTAHAQTPTKLKIKAYGEAVFQKANRGRCRRPTSQGLLPGVITNIDQLTNEHFATKSDGRQPHPSASAQSPIKSSMLEANDAGTDDAVERDCETPTSMVRHLVSVSSTGHVLRDRFGPGQASDAASPELRNFTASRISKYKNDSQRPSGSPKDKAAAVKPLLHRLTMTSEASLSSPTQQILHHQRHGDILDAFAHGNVTPPALAAPTHEGVTFRPHEHEVQSVLENDYRESPVAPSYSPITPAELDEGAELSHTEGLGGIPMPKRTQTSGSGATRPASLLATTEPFESSDKEPTPLTLPLSLFQAHQKDNVDADGRSMSPALGFSSSLSQIRIFHGGLPTAPQSPVTALSRDSTADQTSTRSPAPSADDILPDSTPDRLTLGTLKAHSRPGLDNATAQQHLSSLRQQPFRLQAGHDLAVDVHTTSNEQDTAERAANTGAVTTMPNATPPAHVRGTPITNIRSTQLAQKVKNGNAKSKKRPLNPSNSSSAGTSDAATPSHDGSVAKGNPNKKTRKDIGVRRGPYKKTRERLAREAGEEGEKRGR